ncbi:MAG: hypothetical protein KF884_09380 [Fimbriimonadaceae bacterium]|nr:hypothetical protein [Fimbriimonadaceae bacterium]QYK57757.1 MAG: hypothetical protein KF884_09380 [Fimbriimonadaceae bacterium]
MRKLLAHGLLALSPLAWSAVPPYSLHLVDYLQSEPLTSAAIYPGQYPPAELSVEGGAPAVAWLRTLAPKRVKMTLSYPGPHEHDATLDIGPGSYASASGALPVAASPATFQLHFTPGGSATVEFDLVGLPNFVTLGNLSLPFQCSSIHTGLGGDLGTRIYLTDSTPRGTGYGNQIPVWTDVLEDACLWATGRTGSPACREYITKGLFYSGYATYNGGLPPEYFKGPTGGQPAAFSLSTWSTNKLFQAVVGDCSDMACYLQIACASIGIYMSLFTHTAYSLTPNPHPIGIWTNLLCPIGSDPSVPWNYSQRVWSFHRTASYAGSIFDACAAPWHHYDSSIWKQPVWSWPNTSYWQNQVFSWYYGLVAGFFPPATAGPVGHTVWLFGFGELQ